MKVYPKIPRYDHPTVPDSFFESDSLDVFEKSDGSSFRFTLYDERYSDVYSERVESVAERLDDPHGAIVFGTRKSIVGGHREDLSCIDGAMHRAVRCLRQSIDIQSLFDVHDAYGPVTIYAENMVFTNIDYNYSKRTIPALVGFDVLVNESVESYEFSGNPYDETFSEFLETESMFSVFDSITVEDCPMMYSFVSAPFVGLGVSIDDPDSYTIPQSAFNQLIIAEGVVVRDDKTDRRVKILRDDMSEINRRMFSGSLNDVSDGTEYIVEKYGTQRRIRKEILKMVVEGGYDFGPEMNEDLHRRVVDDIWRENLDEIMRLNREIVPGDVYPKIAKRCINVIRSMEINAELNETDPENIWSSMVDLGYVNDCSG